MRGIFENKKIKLIKDCVDVFLFTFLLASFFIYILINLIMNDLYISNYINSDYEKVIYNGEGKFYKNIIYDCYYENNDEYNKCFKNKTFVFKGIKIEFKNKDEMNEINKKSFFYNKKEGKKYIEYHYYIEIIEKQINKQIEVFNLDEDYFSGLKILICECDSIDTKKNNEVEGFYTSRENLIVLKTFNSDFESVLSHELGHHHFLKSMKVKDKREYINLFLKENSFIELVIQKINFKKNDWEDLIEEKIVDNIKSLTTDDKYNQATDTIITDSEKEFLLKVLKK